MELKHISACVERSEKREGALENKAVLSSPFLCHSIWGHVFSYTTSCTRSSHCWLQRHSNWENHTHSECLVVYILAKCPWHKYDPLKWERYRTTTSEISFPVCKNDMDKKVVSFEKLNILSQDSGLCGFRKDSLSGALSGQSLLGEESLHVFAIY